MVLRPLVALVLTTVLVTDAGALDVLVLHGESPADPQFRAPAPKPKPPTAPADQPKAPPRPPRQQPRVTKPAEVPEPEPTPVPDPGPVTPAVEAAVSAVAVPAPPAEPAFLLLRDGTRVTVRLMQNVSSATAQEGDLLALEVTEDIVVDGKVLVKQGTPARGTVTGVQRKRRMGRSGNLSYTVTETWATDGSAIRLRATLDRAAGSSVGSTLAITAGVAVVVPVVAPFVLLRKGKDILVANGTLLDAFVDDDHQVRQ